MDVLRELIDGAEAYARNVHDFMILHGKEFVATGSNGNNNNNNNNNNNSNNTVSTISTVANNNGTVLYGRTNDATLRAVNEFARTVSARCSVLLERLTPIFDKLSSATNEQIDGAVRALSKRYDVPAARIDELVALFLKLTGSKRGALRFDYERTVLTADPGPRFQRNRRKLFDETMSEVDRTLVRSIDPTKLLDVRELLSRDDSELIMLQRYFQRSSPVIATNVTTTDSNDNNNNDVISAAAAAATTTNTMKVTMFDLLFRPTVTIDYVPRIVGLLVLRQIGLDDMTELFDWIRTRSLALRNDAHAESESLRNEMTRLNFTRKTIEEDLALTTVREKPYYERYLTLVRRKHETNERIRELNSRRLRVDTAVRYLGNITRLIDYYTVLEYNYLSNLTDNDIRQLNTAIVETDEMNQVRAVSEEDADTLSSVTNAYRDYREILLNFMKTL